jgi:hypothetical protein
VGAQACTRTVYLQQSLSEIVCELTVVASFFFLSLACFEKVDFYFN